MGRLVFGAAALVVLASSPAAAEGPWRPGGYTGDSRCAAMLHWASLEPSRTAAEKESLRSALFGACSSKGAAPPPPTRPEALPPPTRFIQVRWPARRAAGIRGNRRVMATGRGIAWTAGGVQAWVGTSLR